jgi:hypothetical protein
LSSGGVGGADSAVVSVVVGVAVTSVVTSLAGEATAAAVAVVAVAAATAAAGVAAESMAAAVLAGGFGGRSLLLPPELSTVTLALLSLLGCSLPARGC